MDRNELQALSLTELVLLARQHGVAEPQFLMHGQLIDRLSGGRAEGALAEGALPFTRRAGRYLRQRLHRLFDRVDRVVGRSVALGRRIRRTRAAAMAAAASTGSGPDATSEVVYNLQGLFSNQPASSLGALRTPQSVAGAVDRANLSEEVARSYAQEGHRDEAIAIYRLLLQERPGDPELSRRLRELECGHPDERVKSPRPRLSPSNIGPHSEPLSMLDLEEPPEVYGVDEVEVLYKDPWWSFVYWEVTDSGLAGARAQLGASAQAARLVLRIFTTQPQAESVAREFRDVPLTWNHGRRYVEVPRPGSLIRVAVGLLSQEGYFAPIAHSSLWRLPPPYPAPPSPVEWMHVVPLKGRGEQRERLIILSRSASHKERSLSYRVTTTAYEVVAPEGTARDAEARLALHSARYSGSGSGGIG